MTTPIHRRRTKRRAELVPPPNFDTLPNSAILRPEACAALLGIGLSGFWRLVDRGELPTLKMSARCTGILVADVRRFIAAKTAA